MSAIKPLISQNETNNHVWLKLVEHYNKRLNTLRRQNDNIDLGAVETAILRGRIKEIERFLGHSKPLQKTTPEPITTS